MFQVTTASGSQILYVERLERVKTRREKKDIDPVNAILLPCLS